MTGCQDGKGRLWSTATGVRLAELSHDREVSVVAFSGDGRWILTGSRASRVSNDPSTVRLWNAATGQPHGTALRHPSPITTAVFSPDIPMVFIGDNSGTGQLWDIATAKPIGPVLRHSSGVSVAAFAPDCCLLVTGDNKGTARLWTVPEPVAGDASQIVSWVEQITGRSLQTLQTSGSQVAVSATGN